MTRKFRAQPLWLRVLIWAFVVWLAYLILVVLLGLPGPDRVERAEAATSCPSYVLVTNPTTGGTYIADACADGLEVSTVTEASVTAVASSASYGSCRSTWIKKTARNKLGWGLYWVRLEKYWCWKGGKVTFQATFDEHVSGALGGQAAAVQFLADRFAGKAATDNCWLSGA